MLASSPDGQWAVVSRGREIALLPGGAGPASAQIELPADDADLVFVGPPSVLAVVTRGTAAGSDEPCNHLMLYQPPHLEAVARLDLEEPMRLAALTGPRLVLVSPDGKRVAIVRVAGRALAAQTLALGGPVEFAVGLDRNQVLFSLQRKLEAWDAVSGRPLLRMQLALPPPPRSVGPAHGHIWAIPRGGDHIVVSRLSDGRPFHHPLGIAIDDVICHPASPLLILITERGPIRLHCFAHSLTALDTPWQPGAALAQLVVGDDITLLGISDGEAEPWRVPIGGAGAPAISLDAGDAPGESGFTTAADRLRTMRERTGPDLGARGRFPGPAGDRPRIDDGDAAPPASPLPLRSALASRLAAPEAAPGIAPGVEPGGAPGIRSLSALRPAPPRPAAPPPDPAWRDPLAAFAAELTRGATAELPSVAADTELGRIADQFALALAARRALTALYALYLVGDAAAPLAPLAQALGDWTEVLGRGELAALAMLHRRGGRVALRAPVTDVLDGAAPRAIRMVDRSLGDSPGRSPGGSTSDAAPAVRPGAFRLARDSRSDAALEAELLAQLGRFAVIEGGAATGLLEAQLYGATAVALVPPLARPQPWPRDASLVVVAAAAPPAWIAALPALTSA